jgi:phosphonate transport system permease protein
MTEKNIKLKSTSFRPFYFKARFIIIALIIGAIYSYGWKVTEIDLGLLIRDSHLVKPLLKDLLKPDLITPNTESITIEKEYLLSNQSKILKEITAPNHSQATIELSSTRGKIGDLLQVKGFNIDPGKKGKLFWVNSIEQEYIVGEFSTDSSGQFTKEIIVPGLARGDVQYVRAVITWKTGGWQLSSTSKLVIEKMIETLFLGLMATSMAIVLVVPLSFLGARNLMMGTPTGRVIYYLTRTFFNVLRSIEPLIMAILFAVWVGIGPFAGVLALGLHSIATLGKLFSEQIENIDPGPVEAITAAGAHPVQVILYGVVPQVLPAFIALGFYRWDINVRMSTIIGFVGGGGIGFLLQQWINLLQYNQAGTALLAIAIVVIALDTVSAKFRENLNLKG